MKEHHSESDGLDKEVESLREDLEEAREQQQATSEVLEALGRFESDQGPVFETVVQNATRLCRADAGHIYIFDGSAYRVAFATGGSEPYRDLLVSTPVSPGPGTLVGRVALEHRTIHIPDARADADYKWRESLKLGGQRTMLGVPILDDDEVIGVVSMVRTEVNPFSQRQIDLVTTFAAQGAIAIQTADLFKRLETQRVELSRRVDELQALADIGEAVSSTLDLQEVLRTIVTIAVELSGADGGSIFEFDPETEEFKLSTAHGTDDRLIRALQQTRIPFGETVVGRAAAERQPKSVPDIEQAPSDPHLDQLLRHGWRSMLALPLLREDRVLGALVVRRTTPGEFSAEVTEVLETFAGQSALAVQNAHLFREIAAKSRQVEVASRHKSEFLASMSHELRTPLNAVIGFSDVLLEGMFGELNAKQRDYLEDIRDSGRHLLELLNEILDLSKIEAGRMRLEPGPFSLSAVLDDGLRMVRDRASQHSIELSVDVEKGVGIVVADELKIKQVVLNLLTNAVKFTPDGGRVEIAASGIDGEVEVTVTDTGIGIPLEDQERIFESFEQGKREAKEEGTGLGLTLSRKIVELHGGRIWVESQPEEGSVFGFTIPRQVPTAEPLELPPDLAVAEPHGGEDGKPTILVVEDDQASIDLLSLHLVGAGFNVELARDGREGLDLARKLHPDEIVLDIILPRLDGWDLLAAVKADPEVAHIPVIIVSMLDERGKGFALGAAEYLVKPVARKEVLSAIQRSLHAGEAAGKVLVIDDDPRAQDLMRAVLEPDGYTVLAASGGEEGVALAAGERPDVVLLDLLMPGVDGFAVVDRLRADPATAEIPIVVLTSKTMTAEDKRRLNGQISYLAQKSDFDRVSLLRLVESLGRTPAAQ
ncbi:MAG TPA: GAF domain-containing protein [Solirubrobacterales bacterium]|nr:GAF domain-containing protein [Solirubrobacterales bacterium]